MPTKLPATFLRPIAHRGLHDIAAGRIENTAAAFEAAITGGFGIECDIRAAAGGLPAVFHDPDCRRVLGRDVNISALDAGALASLTYPDGSAVLTYEALLARVAGRVPILAELKGDWSPQSGAFLDQVARRSLAYNGPLALMSFEPDLLTAMARLAPGVPRGLVAARFDLHPSSVERFGNVRANSLARMEAFVEVGASLVAYELNALPTTETERLRGNGVPVFAWTVRNEHDLELAEAWADAPIFEGAIVERLASDRGSIR